MIRLAYSQQNRMAFNKNKAKFGEIRPLARTASGPGASGRDNCTRSRHMRILHQRFRVSWSLAPD